MVNYLVTLTLYIGEYEKTAYSVVGADNEQDAGIHALESECHGEPDFSEYPNKDACWDMGEMVYKVYKIKELTDQQYKVLKQTGITW